MKSKNIRGSIQTTQNEMTMREAPKLLVSIKDAEEAHLALAEEVDWIDLKNPDAGPLGAPITDTGIEISKILASHANCSVALGELCSTTIEDVEPLLQNFPVAKIGLSHCRDLNWHPMLDKLFQFSKSAQCELVPVIYADWQRSFAPPARAVVDYAIERQSSYVLIDTCVKDSKRLLDLLADSELKEIVNLLARHRIKCVVAGQLSWEMTSYIASNFDVFAVAIRGAVCQETRNNSICPERLSVWVRQFRQLQDSLNFDSLASASAKR